jgi:hypothetical protein
MTEEAAATDFDPASGAMEPNAGLLTAPADGQHLYKIMTVENFLRSAGRRYLYFNRIDSYSDFPGVDRRDGEQLGEDRAANAALHFEKSPNLSLADYYDQSRRRTYACCFSLENSDYVWHEYANGSPHGKVGIVFDFAKLRTIINDTLRAGAALEYRGLHCKQIFSVNYGIVNYVSWDEARENLTRMPNPIRYTYLKDRSFAEERELRIALSALGVGRYVLDDGTEIDFPPGLQLSFDFGQAIGSGAITEILSGPGCDRAFVTIELAKLGIEARAGTQVSSGAAILAANMPGTAQPSPSLRSRCTEIAVGMTVGGQD